MATDARKKRVSRLAPLIADFCNKICQQQSSGQAHWPLGAHCLPTEDFQVGGVCFVNPLCANDRLIHQLLIRLNVSPKRQR